MRFGTCFEERIYLPGSASDSATSGSTGKVRHKAQRSGLGTKGEVRLRIIWVKVFASPENSCREQLDGYATFDLLLPQRNETSPSHDQMVEQSEA